MSKKKFNSLSTPGNTQDLSNYLTELAFLRQNRGNRLPPHFWRMTKYKARYRKEIMACRKFIKKYGEAFVLAIAMDNFIYTWTDFAQVEFLLQQLKEAQERRAAPKDTAPPTPEFTKECDDKRDFTVQSKKRFSLFDRLKELTSG